MTCDQQQPSGIILRISDIFDECDWEFLFDTDTVEVDLVREVTFGLFDRDFTSIRICWKLMAFRFDSYQAFKG